MYRSLVLRSASHSRSLTNHGSVCRQERLFRARREFHFGFIIFGIVRNDRCIVTWKENIRSVLNSGSSFSSMMIRSRNNSLGKILIIVRTLTRRFGELTPDGDRSCRSR